MEQADNGDENVEKQNQNKENFSSGEFLSKRKGKASKAQQLFRVSNKTIPLPPLKLISLKFIIQQICLHYLTLEYFTSKLWRFGNRWIKTLFIICVKIPFTYDLQEEHRSLNSSLNTIEFHF